MIGLKRFRNTVRWKWFIVEEKGKKRERDTSPSSLNTLSGKFSFDEKMKKKKKSEKEKMKKD